MSTAHPLDIVWSVLTFIGLLWCWWLWQDALKTRHFWIAEGMNGDTEINTRNNVRASGIRAMKAGLFLLAGIVWMALPQPVYPGLSPAWLAAAPKALLAIAAALNTVDAILARQARQRVLRYQLRQRGVDVTPRTRL